MIEKSSDQPEYTVLYGEQPITRYDISCDSCSGGNIEVETSQRWGVIPLIKLNGWTVKYPSVLVIPARTMHLCPECSDE